MTSASNGPAAEFSATLEQAPGKQATGIVIPPDVLQQLDAGKKPAVLVSLNGYEYRTTVGVMSGDSMIPVSAAVPVTIFIDQYGTEGGAYSLLLTQI